MGTEKSARKGRRGGREARKELRTQALGEEERPIRPGQIGGKYLPLGERDIAQIHEAVLTILETVGIADPIPSCVEAITAIGGQMSDSGRVLFPRALVEDIIAKAARQFPLYGQDPQYDMHPWDQRVYFGTAGAAVHMVDVDERRYRESKLQDLYDIARVVDRCEHINFFQRSIVCRDLEDPRVLDINTLYASISGTSKHVGTSWVEPQHVEEGLKMLHQIAGSEKKWRERPFVSMSNCFVVPPLKFATDACRCLEAAVRGGMPVLLLAAGQAGATSPASLAGAVVQEMAEVLGGLVYVNAISPSAPAMLGPWPFVSDLRTGAMSGGSGEQALLMAACAQMGNYYNLTTGVCAGMTDSKMPDAQSGHEKSYNYALVANAGANLVYEAAGMHASLLGFCLESVPIDNDAIGAVLRTLRGIETDAESLSLDVIANVCLQGPGHFLGHDQTLARMQKDYVYPQTGNRMSPKEWAENDYPDLIETAKARVADILQNHHPKHIDDMLREKLKTEYPIRI
ncbi:MAG: trimethylamine methyltransferase family protein [Pseudomonadota bacterium]